MQVQGKCRCGAECATATVRGWEERAPTWEGLRLGGGVLGQGRHTCPLVRGVCCGSRSGVGDGAVGYSSRKPFYCTIVLYLKM